MCTLLFIINGTTLNTFSIFIIDLIIMPIPTQKNIKTFVTPSALNDWLQTHHAVETELWIKLYKKASGIASVTWDEVVIECLCWGWIDGIKKSLDGESYLQRITPRTTRSNWSKRNTEHVERLIEAGRIQPSGLLHVEAAKSDGRWEKAYVVSEMTVPEDFVAALESQPEAKQFYQTLTKSKRYEIAHGLRSAKKAETRKRRFDQFMERLVRKAF